MDDYDETDMTEDEFDARWSTGRPAHLAKRPRDPNQLAASIVNDATQPSPLGEGIRIPNDFSSFAIEGVKVESEAHRFRVPISITPN